MREFHLKIVTPDGVKFDGTVESLLARAELGDVEILAGHAEYFSALGTGRVRIRMAEGEQYGASSGGFLSVTRTEVMLVATTFEFAHEIDLDRAEQARDRANEALAGSPTDEREIAIAKAKLMRALSRINVAGMR